MTKIAHYEVYTDNGSGWQLVERFSMEQRSMAYQLAKERETNKERVKIIRETFELDDNSYSESVEYASNLNKKKGTRKTLSNIDYQKDSSEVVQDIADSRRNIYKAIIKFILLIVISLIFANLFVSLLFPMLETFTEDKDDSSLMFAVFFVVFLGLAVPLVMKNIPWYIFLPQEKNENEEVPEEKFYDHAKTLVKAYNINGDPSTMVAGSYPEAPLEYKQYLVYYLSEILSNLNVRTALQKQFSRMGVKLMVFGGCLELARYGGLTITQANSILYEAFRIIDGQNADLETFYEAKQSYKDNKVAIYLTGVGAFLMHQIITDKKLYTNVLNSAFERWEALREQDKDEQTSNMVSSSQEIKTRVSIKSDLKFLDISLPNQENIAASTSESIRAITSNLAAKFAGELGGEGNGLSFCDFASPDAAVKFAIEYLKEISACLDVGQEEKLILRTCCAITPALDEKVNETYVLDMFEHIYNNEIVMVKSISEALSDEGCDKEFLGDKTLKSSGETVELYKLKY